MKKSRFWLLAFFMLVCSIPAFAAGTPAGTQIKNQATAQYKDANNVTQTSTSNEVVTIVRSIYGLTVTPDGTTSTPTAQTATPGTTVYFSYVLTNTGNDQDSFTLTSPTDASNTFTAGTIQIYRDSDGNGLVDTGDPVVTSVGPVPADGIVNLILAYTVPSGATAAQFALVNLAAISVGDNSKADNNNWSKTTVVNDAVLTASKSASSAGLIYPGSTITYSIIGSNTGTRATTALAFTDTIDLTGTGTTTGTQNGILIEDPLPTGTHITGTPGTDFVTAAPSGASKLYGYSNGKWSISGNISGWGGTTSVTKVGLFIAGTLGIGQGFELKWKAVVNDDAPVGTISNKAFVHWSDTSNTDKNTPTNTTSSTVSPSYNVKIGPQGNAEASGAADISTKTNQNPGTTVVFTNTVKNTGTGLDTFSISFSWASNQISGAVVSLYMADGITPLGDSNSDGVVDSGSLAAGATADIVMKVSIPGTTGGDTLAHNITVQAASIKDPTKTDTTVNSIQNIVAGTTTLSNNNGSVISAVPYGKAGAPGSTLIFPLHLSNTNSFAETYTLSQTVALPAGWSVQFYPATANSQAADPGAAPISSTPSVGANGTYTFVAVVTIPAGQAPISGDPTGTGTGQNLIFQAKGSISGQTATQRDWAEVSPSYSFTFAPDNSGTSTAGGTVFYTHTLTNTGNTNQTFSVVLDSTPRTGWTYTFSQDGTTFSNSLSGLTLAAGASKTITVKVYIPSNESIGATDTGVIKATNAGGTSVSKNDITTVVGSNLDLKKKVVSGGSDRPGDELSYTVDYKNLSSQSFTDVYIYDKIPANTGFKVSSATGGSAIGYSNDNGATWTYTPVSAGGGAPANYDYSVTHIRWTITSPLAAGAGGSVAFTVRIK